MVDEPAQKEFLEDSATPAAADEPHQFVELHSGSALSATDAEVVTLGSRAQLIVLAGTEGSGKTTVLASIYEHLNKGPFAGHQFAGSRTLPGFEEICHLNRLASCGTRPETQRTIPTEDASYYHLKLKENRDGGRHCHLLMSAMSGELFRMAMDTREDAERLTYLRRADTIVVLIDGARLAFLQQRANAQSDAASILESIIDANMVSSNCRVEFVFSKLDRVNAGGQVAIDFMDRTEEKLLERFRDRVPNLSFRKIAARPDPSASSDAFDAGLAEAFSSWAFSPPTGKKDWTIHAPAADDREFSKFSWRHFSQSRRDS